jgi:WD40 repeat protein
MDNRNHNPNPNPYVGPRAFLTGEKIYGRDREKRQLLDLLVAERIVILHSPSGAGKTSLIMAGLLPQLSELGFSVLPVIRVNQELPAAAHELQDSNRYIYSVLLSLEADDGHNGVSFQPDELLSMQLSDYLIKRAERQQARQPDHLAAYQANPLLDEVLIFDQFEEILTTNPTDQTGKERFFEQLGEALRDRQRWALFSIREDYLAALAPYLRPVPTRLRTTYRLDLLGVHAALEAIRQPAQISGVEFTQEAAVRLVDDLRKVQIQQPDGSMQERLGPHVEPVQLQVVCYRLWQALAPDQSQISIEDLQTVGDVNESLAAYYAERVAAVSIETGVRERQIREWFQRQLITGQGIRSQVIMEKEASSGLPNSAITRLEDAHLVRSEKRRGVIWFELAHDRLINPVRDDNQAWFHTHLNLLQRQASLWQEENRPERLLLREEALDEAEQWAAQNAVELTQVDEDFLDACRKARQHELEERERQEQAVKLQEQARLANKLRQRFIIATIAAAIALVFFVAAGFFGYQVSVQKINVERLADQNATNAALAQTASTAAVGNEITAVANADLANTASTQASLDRAAALVASTQAVAGQNAALAAQATSDSNAELAHKMEDMAHQQADLAQSRQLASQSMGYLNPQPSLAGLLAVESFRASDTIEARGSLLYNIQRAVQNTVIDLSGQLPVQNNSVNSVALSPDGIHMAWGLSEGTEVLFNLQTKGTEDNRQIHDRVLVQKFSPDGRYLASGGADAQGSVTLRDLQDNTVYNVANLFTNIYNLAFSPNGDQLAITRGSDIVIYDISNPDEPALLKTLFGHKNSVYGLAWSPDGRYLASGSGDNNVVIWNPDQGLAERTLESHTAAVNAVAWSPDSRYLASAGDDNQVIIWDVLNGSPSGQPFKNPVFDFFRAVDFSADGKFLAAGTGSGAISIWNFPERSLVQQSRAFADAVNALDFSPKPGLNLLVAASRDTRLGMYLINTSEPLSEILTDQPASGPVMALVEMQDGTLWFASQTAAGADIGELTGGLPTYQRSIPGAITSAAFNADGTRLAFGSRDGSLAVYETGTGNLIGSHLPIFKTSGVNSIAFHPDNSTIAVTGCQIPAPDDQGCVQSQIEVWDLESGSRQDVNFQPVSGGISAIEFDPLRQRLISGGDDGKILFWDMKTGETVGVPLEQHAGPVTSLKVNPAGNMLASGSADRTIILWDLGTGQSIGPALAGNSDSILSLAFKPNGQAFYSGNAAGSIVSWDIDPGSWVERVCRQVGRNLTLTEWSQFMAADQPYQKTCDNYP